MDKPKITDYVEISRSTTTGAYYNYKRYSIALETYIKHLESKVKTLGLFGVSSSTNKCNCSKCTGLPDIESYYEDDKE